MKKILALLPILLIAGNITGQYKMPIISGYFDMPQQERPVLNLAAILTSAWALYWLDNKTEALTFALVLTKQNSNPEMKELGNTLVAIIDMDQGKLDYAKKKFINIAKQRNERISEQAKVFMHFLGNRYYEKGKTKKALEMWEQYASDQTTQLYIKYVSLINAGIVYLEQDKLVNAAKNFNKVVEQNDYLKEKYYAIYGLSFIHQKNAEPEKEKELLQQLIKQPSYILDEIKQKALRERLKVLQDKD